MPEPELADALSIDMVPLRKQHLTVYYMDLIVGNQTKRLKFRHLSQREYQRINARLTETVPDYEDKVLLYCALRDMDRMVPLTGPKAEQMRDLKVWIAEKAEPFWMACFVDPVITTRDDIEALSSAIPDYWPTVEIILTLLTKQSPIETIEPALLKYCKAASAPLFEGLTGDNMTVQQAEAIRQAEDPEADT